MDTESEYAVYSEEQSNYSQECEDDGNIFKKEIII